MRRSSATSPRSTAVLTAPGHEIVCDSKQTAQQLLQRLTDRFDDTMGETEGILADYEAAEQEIATLFAALNQQIDDVAQSAAQMLERAKAFTDIYREMQHTVSETRQGAEELLSAYEAQASEFLSGDADKVATEAAQTATQPPQPAEVPTEKAEKPEKIHPDTAHSGRIRLVKRPAAVSAPAVEPQTAFQEEAAVAPSAQVQPEAANDAPAMQPAGDIDETPVASAQPEISTAAAPAAAKPAAEDAGFTQFGRKSRHLGTGPQRAFTQGAAAQQRQLTAPLSISTPSALLCRRRVFLAEMARIPCLCTGDMV